MSDLMTLDLTVLLTILAVTFGLFVRGRQRLDLIAMGSLLALYATGLVSVSEALDGFSHPLVIMIAGLFVVGGGLFRTGVADAMGQWLERNAGGSARLTMVAVMLVAAVLSAFISSTGTVAVLIPAVMALAARRRLAPSRLLIPLAFGSLLGGMLTLIGTPPNLVVSAARIDAGGDPFGFFDFTGPGLVMLVLGAGFFALFGPKLLPERGQRTSLSALPEASELAADYHLDDRLKRLLVPSGSSLVGHSVVDSTMRSRFGVTLLAIGSATARGRQIRRAQSGSVIRAGDHLLVAGLDAAVEHLCAQTGARVLDQHSALPGAVRLIEAVVPPRSRFSGKSLRELRLHSGAGVTVVAHRPIREHALAPPDLDRRLEVGDALLMTGDIAALQHLGQSARDLVLLGGDLSQQARRTEKAPIAIGVMLLMLAAMTMGWLPNVIAVLAAAVAMLALRCLTVEEAFGGINWESVILIAAVLPMATALEKTGGMTLAAAGLLHLAEGLGPYALLTAIFVLTSGLSQLVSNTATTVLVAPIALSAAGAMQVPPDPVLITVAIAASTAFLTPVASPVNTLVYNPGGYRFGDFARIGLPLQLLLLIATLVVVPLFFPL
ncbi:MAG: SLC13 family permease [Wenzhouxiangellaceae bacterium]|nr:SLC13 family permease [Wenzhouxiangellaceae bacterium]